MKNLTRIALAAFIGSALSVPMWAGLIGTSVTGDMNIGGINYFDPANGYVPAGYGNSTPGGTTVTIADPGIEFGFMDGDNTNTADFTDNTLTLTDVSLQNSLDFPYTFVDEAFIGDTLTTISDSFPGGIGASLTGDTLTLNFSGLDRGGTYAASYSITSASAPPEPQSVFLSGGALVLLLVAVRRRRIQLPRAV
jgi:hypothetical protein